MITRADPGPTLTLRDRSTARNRPRRSCRRRNRILGLAGGAGWAEAHRRATLLVTVDPMADPQLVTAIAAADRLWGPDEQWRQAIEPRRPNGPHAGSGGDLTATR